MLARIKQKIKGTVEERMYRFLMRGSPQGRKPFDTRELKLLTQALVSQNLFGIDGHMVPAFEKEFAAVYGVPYAVTCTSGTAAIHTALGALDLEPGDEVITAPITDLGTVIPILALNAVPVFADIDHTYNMDPADVERKITGRTKAIVAVHLFGNPCAMDAMLDVARRHKIILIEDCCQAHMTEYKGRFAGTMGDIGCFSFQQSKHMTTGDGGMVITSNKAFYERMKLYVDKGFMRRGWGSRAYGFHAPNYRMNELTAAVGRAQLKKVKAVAQKRHEMGSMLSKLIAPIDGLLPAPVTEGGKHTYWMYPLSVKGVDISALSKEMISKGFWCSDGYTGKPIYLCSESLTAHKTYGTSQFPFHSSYVSRTYDYKEGLCPRAETALESLITLCWDESWPASRVEQAAETFKAAVGKLSAKKTQTALVHAQVRKPSVSLADQKTYKVGIIGCGQVGQWHLDGYRKLKTVAVTACTDVDLNRAVNLAKKVNALPYESYADMLLNEKLDAVSVCTVPSTHKEIVIAALHAGVHVLCEKPLGLSVQETRDMAYKAEGRNKILINAFKFRFFDEVNNAREILSRGYLGKILSFRLMFGGYIDMSRAWFSDKTVSGGGVIMDNAPHAFDLVRYLLGEIDRVQASSFQSQRLGVEDNAQIYCQLHQGAGGIIDLSWTIPLPAKTYFEIYGEEGTLLLDFEGLSYRFKSWAEWRRIPNKVAPKEAFYRQMEHFIRSIESGGPVMTDIRDGVRSLELIEQAYASLILDKAETLVGIGGT